MPGQLSPATLEGWYALHQGFAMDWQAAATPESAAEFAAEAEALLARLGEGVTEGWSEAARLVGAGGEDWMLIHFRSSLEELARAQRLVATSPLARWLTPGFEYLSVTEAGLYHATAEAARETEPGGEEFQRRLEEARAAEGASAHVRSRLYPEPPAEMRYVSFYPMSKRRAPGQNWYALEVRERSRLMREHGLTGRRFSGRIFQVITGSVGLDDWEWGVTLFAGDPLDLKRIVTEMRYDEASAQYGEFGRFVTGIRIAPGGWGSHVSPA
jgi:chlorite dismutase